MTHSFVFGGESSKKYGLYISGSGTFSAPERDTQIKEIPGKNGNLIIDNHRFKNISIVYPAFIRTKFREYTDAARAWLLSDSGYRKLEDTYHPFEYRMARFTGPLDFDVRALNQSGECTLSFDSKPQRFLKSGDSIYILESAGGLVNPTPYEARPLIRVWGESGTLIVGNTFVDIEAIDEYIDIDSDTQNAYKGTMNCNENISSDFPVFKAGETGVKFEGAISRVEIQPRWWTI